MRGPEADLGALHGDWLVQNKMRAHLKGSTQTSLAPNNSDRNRTLIARCHTETLQHFSGSFGVRAIHNDGLKPLAGEMTNSGFGALAVLYGYFQVAKDATQYPHDFLIGAKN